MNNIWIISDTHFNHKNFLNFTDKNGEKIRKFDDVSQMNEYMITKWNETIKPDDKIYHLGDVFFGDPNHAEAILSRLHGKKRLVLGNHDHPEKAFEEIHDNGAREHKSVLLEHFEKIMAWRPFGKENILFSHFPMREDQMRNKNDADVLNVHGHIHQNVIDDPHYFNVCVEHHDYTPIHFDDILAERKRRL